MIKQSPRRYHLISFFGVLGGGGVYIRTSSVVDDDDHSTCCRHELIRRFAHSHFIYTQQFNNNTTSDILATGLEEINSRIYVVPNVWEVTTNRP